METLKCDGIGGVFGVERVERQEDERPREQGVLIWLDFAEANKTYRLVVPIEDARYLRDHLITELGEDDEDED